MIELFVLGALGVSAIKCGIENIKMMSHPYRFLDDGTPVYLDRTCHEHINGEKVSWQYDYQKTKHTQLVGHQTGKVYADREEMIAARANERNEKRKNDAKAKGELAYIKVYQKGTCPDTQCFEMSYTCEISTGKIIWALGKSYNKEEGRYYYWKQYRPDPLYYSVSDVFSMEAPPHIEISEEELKGLNIFGGQHTRCGI